MLRTIKVWPELPKAPEIVCVTCLSSSLFRRMYPIQDRELFASVTMIKLPLVCNFMVCWECHAMLSKVKKFRKRALEAQSILTRKKKASIVSLSNLRPAGLVHWLSIAYKPQIEISPLVLDKNADLLPGVLLKEEIVESETLMPEPQGVDSIEQDPFGESVKQESEVPMEGEASRMDIVKCEFDSNDSSDEEPLIQMPKSNVTYIEAICSIQGSSSGTETASDADSPLNNSIRKPTQHVPSTSNMPMTPKPCNANVPLNNFPKPIQSVPSTSNMQMSTIPFRVLAGSKTYPKIELPLAFVASSILTNNLQKNTESDGPVEYHTGPKLFKNSPQLAIPKMFRSTEINNSIQQDSSTDSTTTDNTYEVRRLTHEEVCQLREEKLKHARSRLYLHYCEKCLIKFSKKVDLELHMKNHDKSAGPFSCSICELRFMTQALLDEHKGEHYNVYTCDACKAEFYNLKSLLCHNARLHQDVLKFCRVCDARFTNVRQFYKHNQIHKKQKECEICHQKCEPSLFRSHMAKHVLEPWIKCDVCDKEFRGRRRLLTHKRNSHAPTDDGGYCVECNTSFKTKVLYTHHMKNSMKHVPDSEKFICEQCNKPLPTKTALKRHIAVSHENSERSECDICKKVYQCKKGIRTHMITKHLKTRKALKNKICELCGKTFQSKSCLEQHMNSHLKLRPYKCDECEATFSYSGARYTHMRLKHKRKKKTES